MSQQQDKSLFILLPILVSVLAVGYFMSSNPKETVREDSIFDQISSRKKPVRSRNQDWQSSQVFENEILAANTWPNYSPSAGPVSPRELSYQSMQSLPSGPYRNQPYQNASGSAVPTAISTRPKTSSSSGRTGSRSNVSTSSYNRPTTQYSGSGQYNNPAYASASSNAGRPMMRQGGNYGVGAGDKESKMGAAQSILSGYGPKQTYQQQKALDQKLNNMSAGIERAIARAMLPKSKRNQNIEKYLSRREGGNFDGGGYDGGISGSNSASAAARQQIASQAGDIVNDMKNNYGDAAAGKAQQIMNDFEKEMAEAFDPNADPQENALRAKAVNNKYNEKLRKLNEEESMNKFEAELRAKNEAQLAKIREKFNPQTEAAAREKMEANLKKRMEIMRTPQSEEDMYRQILELEEQERKDLETVVREQNPTDLRAEAKFRDLQNDYIRDQIMQADEDVKDGRQTQKNFQVTEGTLDEMNASWIKDNQEVIDSLATYGPEVQSQAQEILDQMREQRTQLIKEGGKLNDVNRQNMEITEQANERLKELREQNKAIFIQNVEADMNAKNKEVIESYTRQFSGASDDAKAQWSAKAEVILQKYNRLRAQMAAEAETNPNYSKDMEALFKLEQQELATIEVSVPQE